MPENPIAGTKGILDIPTGGHGHCFSAGPFVPIPERAEIKWERRKVFRRNGRISRNGRGKPAVRPIAGITAAQAGSVPPIADEAWRSAPAADLARTDGVNEILMQKDRKAFR
jgi:hypothetical protein